MFEEARNLSLCVHDADLQRWAVAKARQISLPDFSASGHWIYNFKRKHRIVSRKVSKVVSLRSVRNTDEIETSATIFVNHVRSKAKNFTSVRFSTLIKLVSSENFISAEH